MNIDLVKIHFKDKQFGDISVYKYLPFEYCCDKLKNFEHIVLDDELDASGNFDCYDEDNDVVPRLSFCVEEPQPWEDITWTAYYNISYCPFCGEKININLTNNIDKSKLYTALEDSRDTLKNAIHETDSMKTQKKLEEEAKVVSGKISRMWEFGEYDAND